MFALKAIYSNGQQIKNEAGNSSTKDNTSEIVKDNCVKKMQVLRKEIELLKPKKVIIY